VKEAAGRVFPADENALNFEARVKSAASSIEGWAKTLRRLTAGEGA